MDIKNSNPEGQNINKTLPKQEINPPLSVEKPKTKKTFVFLIIIALLLLIIPGSITYYVLTGENTPTSDRDDQGLEQRDGLDLPEFEDDSLIVEEVDNIELYIQELQSIKNECISDIETTITVEEKNLLGDDTKYEGLLWMKDDIELIKNYSVMTLNTDINLEKREDVKEAFESCIEDISYYLLSEDFIKDASNSFNNSIEGHSINRSIAFEKEDVKIRLHHSGWDLTTSLGDIKTANTPKVFQEIYPYVDLEKDFSFNLTLHNVYKDYALLNIAGGLTAWDTIFERNAAGEWEQSITLYQYLPPCEEFVEANIPPELFDNAPSHDTRKQCMDGNNQPQHYSEYMRDR